MLAVLAHIKALEMLAASDGNGALVQLVIVVVVMIASAIGSLLKKKQEQRQSQDPKAPPAPPAPPTRWPPMGTSTGTTVPSQTRTGPLPPIARPTPPVARPAPIGRRPQADDTTDQRLRESEGVERDRQERSEGIEREVLDQAERVERKTQARSEEVRAKAEAGRRIREAAPQVRQTAGRAPTAPASRAAMPMPLESESRKLVADESTGRRHEMSDRIKALLSQPSWRTAIIMAEILGPPLALRDPNAPGGTTPPSQWA
jgi:hypothetical protein